MLLCFLLSSLVQGQRVEGKVLDAADGIGVIGATIMEVGTTNGTITDIDGSYSIVTKSENPVLLFSFLGYKSQEVEVSGRSTVDVSMGLDAATLDEVVVVGYGTQKKSLVTGAIDKVKAKDIEDMQLSRVEQTLQGRTPGVRVTQGSGAPGSGSVVRVRGTTTLGNSDPLYVVDGVPIGGGIDFLNQNDIESIEVLKDAASAAIYGTRAANGVILITTKKGTKGKMSINYNAFRGWQRPWKKESVLNATEYATLMNEASVASGGPLLYDSPQSLGEGTDWQDHVFQQDAPIVNHELSLSGGGETSTYYASFGYFDQEGIVSANNSRYQRYTMRLNANHRVSDRLTIGHTASYAKVKGVGIATNTEFGSALGRAINLDPITPLYETDEELLNDPSSRYGQPNILSDENGVFGISNIVTSEILNPIAALNTTEGFGWSDKIVANVFGEYELLDGLKFKSSAGADLAFWGSENFTPTFYLNSSNVNTLNSYGRAQNRGLKWIWENTLAYETKLDQHQFGLILGTAAEKNRGSGISANVLDIPVNNLEDASLLFSVPAENKNSGGFEYESRLASVFGRVNYNYAEKYLLTGVLRRDGSTNFGSNKKYGYFPSVSVGWNVSNEGFLLDNETINTFKIRGSWGLNGNQDIPPFSYLPLVVTGANYTIGQNDNLVIGTLPGAIANPDLAWEETEQINFGFDSRLFKDITFSFDVFQKRTTGLLQVFEIPGFVGFPSGQANIGEMENRGFEVDLGITKEIAGVGVEFFGNIAYLENEVVYIAPDIDFLAGRRFGPPGIEISRTTVGNPIGHFYGYQTDGIFQNQAEVDAYVDSEGEPMQPNAAPGDFKFKDTDGDGDVDEDDRTSIGDPTPTWTYGTTLKINVGQFDVQVFGQGVFGNEVFKATRRFDLQQANLTSDALDRWTGEGTSTEYPRLVFNDPNRNFSRSSDFYVESGAYFRIKNFQIGYNLPENLRDKMNIQKARFYVGVNNLMTITAYSGLDPEIGDGFGVDTGIYPQARTFLFGANITY